MHWRLRVRQGTDTNATLLAEPDQRFYTSGFGRFMSADRSHSNLSLSVSGSWNRYSYVDDDPINGYDPTGKDCELVDNGGAVFVVTCAPPPRNGGGVGGRTQGNSPNDPTPLTPQQAYQLAQTLQKQVSDGGLTDCQALADFADSAAAVSPTSKTFIQAFGALVPKTIASQVGLSYWNTSAVALNTGQASGYTEGYQNSVPDNASNNGDQGHHFAAFLELGYQFGGDGSLASIASAVYEYAQAVGQGATLNMGDIQLGITAAQIGAGLRNGNVSAGEVGALTNNSICKH
jgi:RHS repeat-associated protein